MIARGVALLWLVVAVAADPARRPDHETERLLAAIEDLQLVEADRLVRGARRGDDPAWLRGRVLLLASQREATELDRQLLSWRTQLERDASRQGLRHALLFARSLRRGYRCPWLPPLHWRTPSTPGAGDLVREAQLAAEEAPAGSRLSGWANLLAARLAPAGPRRASHLRAALEVLPQQLEVLAACLADNLDRRSELWRERLVALARTRAPRAPACALAVAADLLGERPESASPTRRQSARDLLAEVRRRDERYADDAAVLLAACSEEPSERRALLESVLARGPCSAYGAAHRRWLATLSASELEPAAERVEAFELEHAWRFGSLALAYARVLARAQRFEAALSWFAQAESIGRAEVEAGRASFALGHEALAELAAAASALGRWAQAAEVLERASEQAGAGALGYRARALLARGLSAPSIFLGAAICWLTAGLALPLALVALRTRRRPGGWRFALAVAVAVVGADASADGRLQIADLPQGLALLVIAAAGVGLSRQAAMGPGRELRRGRRARGALRVLIATAALVAVSAGLMWWVQPRPSPLIERLSALAPNAEAARLLEAARSPWAATGIALRAALREELICRLFFLPLLALAFVRAVGWRRARWLAVAVVSAVWALAHMGVAVPEIYKLTQVLISGLILGWLTLRQGVISAWLAHSAANVAFVWLTVAGAMGGGG